MSPEQVETVDFDPFDVTKVWPRSQFPQQEVGVLTLNRNPEDYHRDVEQAAFSPGSLVPGIELSPDTLLQWRAFFVSWSDFHEAEAVLTRGSNHAVSRCTDAQTWLSQHPPDVSRAT